MAKTRTRNTRTSTSKKKRAPKTESQAMQRARRAKKKGLAPTTQAGAFVHKEMEHMKEKKHSARNPRQAIAIGLSKARRRGIRVPAKKASSSRRKSA